MRKPAKTASDYSPGDLIRVRQTCLYVASYMPRHLAENITVVGGLVPSLLIKTPPPPGEPHLGTTDLDIGLALGLQGVDHYEELTKRLLKLGFTPERTEDGKPASIRWKSDKAITSEMLIDVLPVVQFEGSLPPTVRIPGTELSARTKFAFLDREPVELSGECITGKHRDASIWVCGPGAYIVIKALTFANRNHSKDAYDLFYVLRNYGSGVQDVVGHLAPLLSGSSEAQRALNILRDDFADPNGDGAKAVPLFLYGKPDEDLQADVAGFAGSLLACFGM